MSETREAIGSEERRVSPWWLVGLGIAAAGLRLAFVLVVGKDALSWGDEFTYDLLARNLVSGVGYGFAPGEPSVWRAPLYPMTLAVIYSVFGSSYLPVTALQAIVGGLTAPLLVMLGLRLFKDPVPAMLAGAMFALHPLLIFTVSLLYSETIYLALLLLFTLACLSMASDEGRPGWAVVSGMLLGLSVLMKPNLMLFPVVLFLWVWLMLRRLDRALIIAGLASLVMVLVVLPWTVRNYRVTGEVVPVSANSGLNLWQGNHPRAEGAAFPLSQVDPLTAYSEAERDRIYRSWALEQLRSDPVRLLTLVPKKIGKFFAPLETSNRGQIPLRLAPVVDLVWLAFLALAAWGFIRTVGRSEKWVLIYLLILYPVGLAVVFYGATRYGMVVYPYLFLLASDPLGWLGRCLLSLLRSRRPGAPRSEERSDE
jgi:4-amino-4-deoxy-L-arabinose transferase-like glycosyltransferase